ncbi:arylsulfatase [Frigidibacter sp. RF13]|uniref:arylsulfatase n=1 Tax=Frigidibacter sp. RF13 TaxID=2997340 RepID=UPI00226DCD03|nr:arylsulfatase [Frigidibacter sp. RF13]MCY1128183.1 arylsulfatase [Frigidibacter sp. RF13]
MQEQRRPNIILVLVDDMGFADLGHMGSEIRTPNIDSLARNGLLLSSMYNCARCCPTRASLLTGLYPHNAGIGHMGANLGTPAYQGYLRNDAATIAELMRDGGYRTLMSGKWHVGGDFWARLTDTWRVGDVDRPTPRQRGFDRFYGIIDGVTHFFSPHYIMEDDARVDVSPTDFYFTDAITDKAIGMIEESVALDQPFFLYLAHAAPHWPLHAHEEDIAKYDGTYQRGWDKIRTGRHEEMLGRGVLQHNWAISPRDEGAPEWNDVLEKDWEASRMAVYAAMVDRMDQSIGRVLEALKRLGQYEDTLILFLSDNGGCAEFMAEDGWAKFMPDIHNDGRKIEMGNRPSLRPGGALTYMSYDLPWANVSNAPFRLFKHWVHEGGISTPLIAHWPNRIKAPRTVHAPAHVIDLLPTILEAGGVMYPDEFGGQAIQKLDGESLVALIDGKDWSREQPLYWEHEGNAAIRAGNFKLVRKFNQPWELYDMESDRTELNDLMGRNEPLTRRLTTDYEAWAEKTGVMDWNIALPKLLSIWQMEDAHG